MPQRKIFKSMFVEIVSFLTLFAVIGTMTSNFWERYLIQSELSNVKSSLNLLKETVYNIGAAYDNLHHELNGLTETKNIKSKTSIPQRLSRTLHRNTEELNTFSNMVMQEIIKLKANKSIGVTKSIGTDSPSEPQKVLKSALRNAATATTNPLKSTGINLDPVYLDSRLDRHNYITRNIHKCCKDDCRDYKYNCRKY